MNTPPIQLLLVDDNPMDAAMALRMLKTVQNDLPVTTRWVDTAEKAIEAMQHGQYDLLLLDYQLPHTTGLDMLREIRKAPAALQPAVIMLTASGSEKVAVEAMKSGARDYLRKDELDVAPLTRAIMSAISQKRLEDQIAALNTQRAEDLSMAREMQLALLPQSFPPFPPSVPRDESALSFCARYLPATDLGGDFYDVIPISAAEAGVLLCDVMGHGVRAALVVAMIRALVEELQPRLADPAALLAGVNAGLLGLLRKTGRALFATAIYMVVDARHMQVRYAAAGHPEPFLVSAQTRRVTRLLPGPGGSGPALGLLADASFSNATTPLRNGDRLVLYTDGITEAANANGEEYGAERLCAALEHRAEWPCDRAFDDLLAEVRAFAAQEILADDVCLLCTELRHAIPA